MDCWRFVLITSALVSTSALAACGDDGDTSDSSDSAADSGSGGSTTVTTTSGGGTSTTTAAGSGSGGGSGSGAGSSGSGTGAGQCVPCQRQSDCDDLDQPQGGYSCITNLCCPNVGPAMCTEETVGDFCG